MAAGRRGTGACRGGPGIALLLAGGLLLPGTGAVQGQQGSPARTVEASRGWIGIVHEGDGQGAPALHEFPGGHTGLVVKDVVAGSPARAAGLRPGDVILAMDGRPLAPATPTMLQVRDGQAVQLRLLRDGRVVETRLVAARRPSEPELVALGERTARVDSLRVHIIQEMDSLLERDQRLGRSHSIISIFRLEEEGRPVVVVQAPRSPEASTGGPAVPAPPPAPPGVREPVFPFRFEVTGEGAPSGGDRPEPWGWVSGLMGQEPGGVPFGTFVLSRDRVDGLVEELKAVRGSLEALQAEERARERQRGSGEAGREGSRLETDLQRVRDAQRRLHAEAQRLEREMRLEGQRSLRREAQVPPAWTPAVAPPVPGRPLSPYVLGQRMVAGAEMTALNPDLAEYFGGEEGLLVLDVVSGSPAAEAGILVGDVVTRMGDRAVRTLDEARLAVESSGHGPIPVTLVRRGRSILATLPR